MYFKIGDMVWLKEKPELFDNYRDKYGITWTKPMLSVVELSTELKIVDIYGISYSCEFFIDQNRYIYSFPKSILCHISNPIIIRNLIIEVEEKIAKIENLLKSSNMKKIF